MSGGPLSAKDLAAAEEAAALIQPYTPEEFTPPRVFELSVVALDPTFRDSAGKVVLAKATIPATRLAPGPWGPRFHVVDFDATTQRFIPGVDLAPGPSHAGWLAHDLIVGADDDALGSPPCRAQNVYAIAARTLASFEFALGRPIPWAFGAHQLNLVPAAFAEANAYYADDDQALYFGYFQSDDGRQILSSLSYDIVAHETTHAILDGLRRRFDDPGLPDQFGFHEGFADVVALLSVFSLPEVVAHSFGGKGDEIIRKAVSHEALASSTLLQLAKQFGDELHANRGHGLRDSVNLHPTKAWRNLRNRAWLEPHRRGEVLVAAVTQTLVLVWHARLQDLLRHKTLSRARAAEEGARAARHLLEMLIRAIDYCPPVEFAYDDFLVAVLVADSEVAPTDELDYRGKLTLAFSRFGIEPTGLEEGRFTDATKLTYRNFHYQTLRSDQDEVARFLWDNTKVLKIDPQYYLHVEDVRPAVRVGPDGFIVSETVVDYVQELIGTASDFRKLAGARFAKGAPDDVPMKIFGGGTVIFDQFGVVKYHYHKPIDDWDRQRDRMDSLLRRGISDTKGRFGFSWGTPVGQRFAAFHRRTDPRVNEEW
jgi:hypothetical protein